jgi:hypothetical protein
VKIVKSAGKALAEFESGGLASAMIHACNTADGTARETYGHTTVFR